MNQSFNLTKGTPFNLTKADPHLRNLRIGLGWAENPEYDLDVSALLLDHQEKMFNGLEGYVGYAKEGYTTQGVVYGGDSRSGSNNGDAEYIDLDSTKLLSTTSKIIIATSIYGGLDFGQSFKDIKDAYLRLVNLDTNKEVARLNLTQVQTTATGLLFGELQNTPNGLIFVSNEEQIYGGLAGVLARYGINVPPEIITPQELAAHKAKIASIRKG